MENMSFFEKIEILDELFYKMYRCKDYIKVNTFFNNIFFFHLKNSSNLIINKR